MDDSIHRIASLRHIRRDIGKMLSTGAMPELARPVYLAAFATAILFFGSKVLQYGMRPKNFPPGPPTIPILGNLLALPMKDLHLFFEKMAKKCMVGPENYISLVPRLTRMQMDRLCL